MVAPRLPRFGRFVILAASLAGMLPMASAQPPGVELPVWVNEAGARREPGAAREFRVAVDPARANGKEPVTRAIQATIDDCAAAGGGRVFFSPGVYLTGALFVRSGVHLQIDAGVTLRAVQDDAAYPRQPTRIAGIEMTWPVGLLNVNEAEAVEISGNGEIDGNGEYWWSKYARMRKEYDPRGLRWIVDYDCERVRLIVIRNSKDVTVRGLHLRRSGFWNLQVLYSEFVTVDGITVRDAQGPSTDGVDIDSSSRVLVENCDIDNNDDCICLKAGRDADGLRVNRPVEYVVIRDNTTRRGGGIVSFGSETSGGIRHIVAWGNRGLGTKEGLRFKSARTRGGFIEDVRIYDTRMNDVAYPITFTLDWNPKYSYAPAGADTSRWPEHWRTIAAPVLPASRGLTEIRDIRVRGAEIIGAKRIITAAGLPERPLGAAAFEHIRATGKTAGSIEHVRDWRWTDAEFTTQDGAPVRTKDVENLSPPQVRAGAR